MKIILFVISFLFVASASGASFDCRIAGTSIEKLICEDMALSRMDDELSLNYKKALNSLGDNYKENFIKEQRSWLKFSRNLCDDASCLRHAYEVRNKQIAACNSGCSDTVEDYASNGERHNLVIFRDANERNHSFNLDLKSRKLDQVLGCEALVDIAVGTAHGNNSFGGLCKVRTASETKYMMVCNDDLIGHFQMVKASRDTSIHELADFTIKYCFGG